MPIGQINTGRRKPRKYKEDAGVQELCGRFYTEVATKLIQNKVLGTTLITCEEPQPIKEPQVTPLQQPPLSDHALIYTKQVSTPRLLHYIYGGGEPGNKISAIY